jgi:lipoprotein-anchoring transpeptidase ErfK/SrfK
MRARKPSLPLRMTGGLSNPLGAKAIYLGATLYRIHGTNDANSIGEAASSGCFRMHNEHVVHLAGLVTANTTVYVLKRLPKGSLPAAFEPAKVDQQGKDQKI